MKTLQQIQDQNHESLDEGSLRTVSGVVIVGKIKTIEKQIKSTKKVGEIFNLGCDKPQSINQLAKLIGGKVIYIPDRPGEPKKTWANINKIKKKLNWKPTINFKDGIKNMLNQIDQWKTAPLWTPKSINVATKTWFKYLK